LNPQTYRRKRIFRSWQSLVGNVVIGLAAVAPVYSLESAKEVRQIQVAAAESSWALRRLVFWRVPMRRWSCRATTLTINA
jgi:hypothetical protein